MRRPHSWIGLAGLALLLGLAAGTRLGATGDNDEPPRETPKREEAPLGMPFPTDAEHLDESDPSVYADAAGRVYRLWVKERRTDKAEAKKAGFEGGEALFTRSEDGGLTWLKEPIVLPDRRHKEKDGLATLPQLALGPDRELYSVWRSKYRTPKDRLVHFQSSPDRGATWAPESRTLNRGVTAFDPQIALGPGRRIYVAWSDERLMKERQGHFDIFFVRSEDGGKTWSPETHVTDKRDEPGGRLGTINAHPRLVTDAWDRIYLSWVTSRSNGSGLVVRRSADFGATWEPPIEIGAEGAGSSTGSQALLPDGTGGLTAIWSARRGAAGVAPLAVYASRLARSGGAWSRPVRIDHASSGGAAEAAFPAAAAGPDGVLWVAWQDTRNGREDIYMNLSRDGGETWLTKDVRVDQDPAGTSISRQPRIAVSDKGTVAVAWADDRAGFARVLVAFSQDAGKSWHELRADDGPANGDAREIRLAWGPGEVLHATWETWRRLGVSNVAKTVHYRRLTAS